MFSTSGKETVVAVGQFLEPGRQQVKILSGVVADSQKTGKKALNFVFEGPIPYEGYEGLLLNKDDKEGGRYNGPIAFVTVSNWLTVDQYNNPNPVKNSILNVIMYFADCLALRQQVDTAVEGSATIEEFVEKAMTVLNDKPFWIFLTAKEEEYQGKVRVKLNFYPSKSVSLKKENLEEYNPENSYHFKKLKKAAAVPAFTADAGASEFDLPA